MPYFQKFIEIEDEISSAMNDAYQNIINCYHFTNKCWPGNSQDFQGPFPRKYLVKITNINDCAQLL